MGKALTPYRGALLRRGIGYALLAASAGCATHAPQTQFPLAPKDQQSKIYQGVCVQIGIKPANSKPGCNQLAQPNSKHHVEPLPLDEFGYLFPPLKPELTKSPIKTTHVAPSKIAASAPSIAATTAPTIKPVPVVTAPSVATAIAPVAAAPMPTVAPIAAPIIAATHVSVAIAAPVVTAPPVATAMAPVSAVPLQTVAPTAAPVIAATHVSVTKAVPVVTVPSIATAVAPVTAVPLQPLANVAAPSIAATHVPLTRSESLNTAPAIHTTISPMTAALLPQPSAPLSVKQHYITKTVHFNTHLPFKLNSAHLVRHNREEILAFVNSLEKYRGVERICITGHTDTSGPKRFNMWLSGMRAKSVQLLLLSLGADPRTTFMRGVGSNEPRPHANSAAENRYVDITVTVREPMG